MRKFLLVLGMTLLVLGAGSSSAFFINFEDGRNGASINNIPGVSFKNFKGYYAMYGDSRVNRYNTCSDDLNKCYNKAIFHHRGNFWLWAGTNADARGVIVDFTNNNGTWFQTGYSAYGNFILEARLTNGGVVTKVGPSNTYKTMGYLKVNAPAGTYIDYIVLKGDLGNAWLVDDMSGNTTGVGTDDPPSPPTPPGPNSDDDRDGMPYAWEVANGLNPSVNDAAADSDRDGLSNLAEYQKGTNPKKADTDRDGMPDGWEVNNSLNPKTNDASADLDDDGLSNIKEYQKGTDPHKADTDGDGMPDGWETAYNLNPKANDAAGDPDGDEVSNLDEYLNGTNPTTIPGEFRVGESGIVKVDWLYDGGMYQGELGIFSFSGMKNFISEPEAFIKEAVRRTLSDSVEGYVVLSDPAEGARLSGPLGEPEDWNSGPYNGIKSFAMTPGDTFAAILVPNSTFADLYENPLTQDAEKRPLFSLVLSNLDYGMHVGQVADVDGLGEAFVFEDQDFAKSDMDYNDLIVQVIGAAVDVPPLDSLINKAEPARKRSSQREDSEVPLLFNAPPPPLWHDWRTSDELGRQIVEHIDVPEVQADTLWVAVMADASADLIVYDPEGKECGKEGGYIPGAAFEIDENGAQAITLPALETGNYRVIIRGKESDSCIVTVNGYQGDVEIASQTKEVRIAEHQSLTYDLSVSLFTDDLAFTFELAASLFYDFNGDGKIDDNDISRVYSRWNVSEGDQEYDYFYDFDGDGYIGITDIMQVVSKMSAP
ncbi:DUF4114 domain-containing protein [Desulfococcaceae bacterium HSG8]|nr:DUF4114 domain-containing protein [Desulfococcaceae bacterium HSG8]